MNKILAHSPRGVFALLALAFAASSASAGNPGMPRKMKPIPDHILKKYDLNQDGRLDEAEIAVFKADRRAEAEKKRVEAEQKRAEAKKAAALADKPTPAADSASK
jgi:hypothetical protein